MRILYSIAFYLGTPFILLHFAIRGLKDRAYLEGWKERFALNAPGCKPHGIVVHAASVGEVNAAAPLVRALLERSEDANVTVTTFTPTGSRRLKALFGDRVNHFYAPLDLPGAVKRFFDRLQPGLLIIMETEIWPNLYHQAGKRKIPLLMANARLSEKSLQGYGRFPSLIRNALHWVSHASAQSKEDAERLVSCGLDRSRVEVSGNLKFDATTPQGIVERATELREKWGPDRPVIMAASTHAQDDAIIFNAFNTILETFPNGLLIVVPRHPERFSLAAKQASDSGLRTELRSNGRSCSPMAQCFVIDSMGELIDYYACSDIAIIGGSFGATGGHNALEASALSLPVIVGPNTESFAEITRALIEAGAALRVLDAAELSAQLISLLRQPERRASMGASGFSMVEKGKGALKHTLEVIDRLRAVPLSPD